MKTVYSAESALDAQIIHDLLDEAGFKVFIAGAALSGAAGELPVGMGPEVKVLVNSDYLAARAIVEDYFVSKQNLDSTNLICPHCGEKIELGFHQCWNCGELIQ